MIGLVHLGDYVSYYLAMLNRTDPMPVPVIDQLKARLAQSG
jgi:glucose/mannose-6-phosphate isomerase